MGEALNVGVWLYAQVTQYGTPNFADVKQT